MVVYSSISGEWHLGICDDKAQWLQTRAAAKQLQARQIRLPWGEGIIHIISNRGDIHFDIQHVSFIVHDAVGMYSMPD